MSRAIEPTCANDRCTCAVDERHYGKPVNSTTYGPICCRRCYKSRKDRQFRTTHTDVIAAHKKARYPHRFRESRETYEQGHPDAAQDRQMRRLYGITARKYDEMVMTQCGTCAVCGKPEGRVLKGAPSRLAIHHDHATGRVLGLLCHRCNTGIGMLGDDVATIRRALALQEGR